MFGKANRLFGILLPVLIIASFGLLIGCGTGGLTDAASTSGTGSGTGTGGTGGTGTGGGAVTSQTAVKIILDASPKSVKSGGGDAGKSTIKATVKDIYNARIPDQTVYFKTDGGDLNTFSAKTGANGEDAEMTFSSGSNSLNGIVTVTASSKNDFSNCSPKTDLCDMMPVIIYGTSLTKATTATNLTTDGSVKDQLEITAIDANGNPIRNATLTFSSTSLDGGAVEISANTKVTDTYGKASVTVTGKIAGKVTVKAMVTPVDPMAPETSVTQDYTIITPANIVTIDQLVSGTGSTVNFSDLINSTYYMETADTVTVKASAPASAKVRFATSRGSFDGIGNMVENDPNPVAGKFEATFSCTIAGFATIEVTDATNNSNTAALNVFVSAPLGPAPQIKLESSSANLPPSTGGVVNTVKLTATVTTSIGEKVAGVPVSFSISGNATGGKEFISPLTVLTDGTGRAITTFTSGALGSIGQGVTVQANLASDSSVYARTSIFITGTPGSVAIGRGTLLTDINVGYRLPIVVMVADSEGHAVPNRNVSLKLWPSRYATGTWSFTINPVTGSKMWVATRTSINPNEDLDEDTIRDTGEDVSGDGQLTPPNSAAGVIPTTVMTDLEGKAIFELIYAKEYANWIEDRLTATIEVGGTETTSTVFFWLLVTKDDVDAGFVFDSPFGP